MQVTVDREVLRELQYMVELHRMYGAPNPFNSVEGLVAYVLACVAEGSRRPGAWERTLLDSMGLVALCSEHERYRTHCGDPADCDEALPMHEAPPAPAGADRTAKCDDPAVAIVEIVELLSRMVAALHSVRGVFDTPEYRDAMRRPREAAALQQVYRALGRPWPADALQLTE
ncbi:hypothetical protein [Methylibium rhizosphaerae]|uniref:hypothetical protein n=1 Tax=Methylibium rhizosphaerae TaxID=2570323 RepID=UPI0015E4755B|nr:hypothetical protein [Methylibium rhizosphaerae]